MSVDTSIEWTDATWNPVVGCTRVSAGCDHCYAARQTYRLEHMGVPKYAGLTAKNAKGDRHFNGVVRCDEAALSVPLKRKKATTYFVNSMSDLFHRDAPFEFIDKVFAVMALCPQHVFQILTKRPERMAEYLATRTPIDDSHRVDRLPQWYQVYTRWFDEGYGGGRFFDTEREWDAAHAAAEKVDPTQPLKTVWLGTSCEDQAAADERIPHLLRCPAAVRFLSCEPLLGPIGLGRLAWFREGFSSPEFQSEMMGRRRIDWVIAGGESGPGARPCDVDWIRSIVRQCQAAEVPAFVKQLGKHVIDTRATIASACPDAECWPDGTRTDDGGQRIVLRNGKGGDMNEWPEDLRVREMPEVHNRAYRH